MNTTRTRTARLCAAAVATVALTAAIAAPASAASWNTPGQAKVSGTITYSSAGQSNLACTLHSASPTLNASGNGSLQGVLASTNCTNLYVQVNAWVSNPANWTFNNVGNQEGYPGPYGIWYQWAFSRPWTNATATTPSKIVLNNTHIGRTVNSGADVYATGTINLTTAAGGQLKINP